MEIYPTLTSQHYREFAQNHWRLATHLMRTEGPTDRTMRMRRQAMRYDWLADQKEKEEEEARKRWPSN